jgi:hypothetical protein
LCGAASGVVGSSNNDWDGRNSSRSDNVAPDVTRIVFCHCVSCPFLDEGGEPTAPLKIAIENSMLKDIWKDCDNLEFSSKIATHAELLKMSLCATTILHLSAHGQNGVILLEYPCETDNMGKSHLLTADLLAELKSEGAFDSIKLLFLSCCRSEAIANVFISNVGIPHIVAIVKYVRDDVAQRFAKYFYCQLRDGCSVKDAFDCARKQVENNFHADEASHFKLLPEDIDHGSIFFKTSKGTMSDTSPVDPLWSDRRCEVSGMVGRLYEYDTYRYVHNHGQSDKNVVVISGEAGTGKSEVYSFFCSVFRFF